MMYPDVNRRLSISLEKEESRIYLQDSDNKACSKDKDSDFPELQDMVSMHFSSFSITLKL